MPKIVCSAQNVSKTFGDFKALNDVSIEMHEHEIFGLLGSNGAGKSTLTKIMTGLLKEDSGRIAYYNYELWKNYSELKKVFSVVPQEISCYHGFSIEDNLRFFGLMHGIKGKELREKTEYLLDWLPLKRFREKPVEQLSGGYRRMVNIACSLVHDPQIIFMDEPSVGLDPKMRHLLWEKIKELKEQGKTICLTTHYLDEAQALCDRVGLLIEGRLITHGRPIDLIQKHGGYRIVVIKLNKIAKQDVKDIIGETFDDVQVEVIGNTIVISFQQEHSLEKISLLTQWLLMQGYEVTSSIVKEPELEDVFLNLTGDTLRG